MAAASTDPLMDALRQLRLLDSGRLAEVDLDLVPRFPDPKALARELIRRDWLTPYQANQLLQGRGQQLVLGSYILLERLGEGAMGQVFKARHRNLGRVCAVKLIRKERLESPNAVKRFQREVRAAAALSHPNIVLADDADEIDGAHLLVMEYVEGTDLARLVKEKGPLTVARACEYVRQAALGLQHAHERGLVHRDIKPHNLLLSADGQVVKILDMGIARLDAASSEDDQSSTMTQTGAVMGTPDYLSPEQAINAHTADIRADIYSLGCTLYFLLAGDVPFPGGALGYKLVRHRMEEPAPLEKVRPGVPPWTAQVVRKMMAKKPEDRFQTPAAVADALACGLRTGAVPSLALASEDRTLAAAPVPAAADTLDPSSSDAGREGDTATSAPYRFRRQAPARRWLLYSATGAASVGVAAVAVVLLLFHLPGPNKPVRPDHDGPEGVVTPSPGPLREEGPPTNPEPTRLPPVIFQDFESGTYGDWKKTGTAFGDRPAAGTLPSQQYVSGYGGKYLVNTFLNGDGSTGTLTSPEFTIKHSYIRFRIGGGYFAGRTCMNLLVGGAVVRTAAGKGAERLEWTYWDVKPFKGRPATIQIVDQATGPWGHVNVDDILFTDELPR